MVAESMSGADEVYNTREQMNTGQEHSTDTNTDTNTDVLNGITEAAQASLRTEEVDGEGTVDTEMAGTA